MNLKNCLLIIFNPLFKFPKFRKLYFIISVFLLNNGLIDDEEFKEYVGRHARKICDKYVLEQKFYLDKKSKNIIDQWTSRYYQGLNEYIRGIIIPPFNKIKEYEKFRKDLSELISSTEGLKVNTTLFRGEKEVDIESRFKVGEVNKFSGFIATSFSKKKARNFSKTSFTTGYVIKINAKKNTKGIAINGVHVGSFKNQYEWLLNENSGYITKKIDEKHKIIEIDLI